MPRSSHLALPFLAPPQPLSTYERGRDLCTFVSTAASHVMRTLQRPRKARPNKRKINHRRFLQNQICRSFSDIEAATRRLASSILSQEAAAPPATSQKISPKPCTPCPVLAPPDSFLGIAEAFVAPDPSPGSPLSLGSLMPDPAELFEPITNDETQSATNRCPFFNPDSFESGLLVCNTQPDPQAHVGSAVQVGPDICPPVTTECSSTHAFDPGALVLPAHDTCVPFWDLEMW